MGESMMRMIDCVLICLLFVGCVCVSARADDNYRTFTSTDGRTIEAKLVRYDDKKGEVFIERADKMRMWVKPDSFSNTDQNYVHEWIKAEQFLSERSLMISVEETKPNEFNQYDKVGFKLLFENRTGEPMPNVRCEIHCCIRRTNQSKTSESINWAVWDRPPDVIQPGRYSWKTREIYLASKRAKTRHVQAYDIDEIEGVWIRLFGPPLDGKPVVRDVIHPAKIGKEYDWSDAGESELTDYLNPYAPKKPKVTEHEEGTTPVDQREYQRWFHELVALADYYMHIRPVELEESRKYVEKLKKLYDPKYETDTGSYSFTLGRVCYQVKDYKNTIDWYEECVSSSSNSSARARLISLYTGGMKTFENAPRAIEHATVLVNSDKDSFNYLDLLARAYARNGQFEKAIEMQETAIKMMKRQGRLGMIDQYVRRLELYKQNMPYDDPPPDFFS